MKIKFNKYVQYAFFYVAILGVIGRQYVLPGIRWQQQLFLFVLTIPVLNGLWLVHYIIDYKLNDYFPFEKNIPKRVAIQLLISWGLVKTILVILFYYAYGSILPTFPYELNRLNYLGTFAVGFLINIVVGLGFISTHFLRRWQENAVRAAILEKEKLQVLLDNLKNQMSPHFLFNSLSSLDSLIHDNPELASQFLRQLSKVFRYVIQHKDKDLVSLETELEFIKTYVYVLKIRFAGALAIQVNVPEETTDKLIAPVTLQILIENALKHNIVNMKHPLSIRIVADEDYLTVENELQRKPRVETSNGQGLANLTALYQYLSEKKLQVEETPQHFRVRVPLIIHKGVGTRQIA